MLKRWLMWFVLKLGICTWDSSLGQLKEHNGQEQPGHLTWLWIDLVKFLAAVKHNFGLCIVMTVLSCSSYRSRHPSATAKADWGCGFAGTHLKYESYFFTQVLEPKNQSRGRGRGRGGEWVFQKTKSKNSTGAHSWKIWRKLIRNFINISNLLLHLPPPDIPLVICTHHKFLLTENEVAWLEIRGSYQDPEEQCIDYVKRKTNDFSCDLWTLSVE